MFILKFIVSVGCWNLWYVQGLELEAKKISSLLLVLDFNYIILFVGIFGFYDEILKIKGLEYD